MSCDGFDAISMLNDMTVSIVVDYDPRFVSFRGEGLKDGFSEARFVSALPFVSKRHFLWNETAARQHLS